MNIQIFEQEISTIYQSTKSTMGTIPHLAKNSSNSKFKTEANFLGFSLFMSTVYKLKGGDEPKCASSCKRRNKGWRKFGIKELKHRTYIKR